MRYLFKPAEKTRIRLFANSFEAVVFWIAVAGLLFLAIISLYRGFYLKNVTEQYNSVAGEVNPAFMEIRQMIAINDSLVQDNRELQTQMEEIESQLDSLKNLVSNLQITAQVKDSTEQNKKLRKVYLPER